MAIEPFGALGVDDGEVRLRILLAIALDAQDLAAAARRSASQPQNENPVEVAFKALKLVKIIFYATSALGLLIFLAMLGEVASRALSDATSWFGLRIEAVSVLSVATAFLSRRLSSRTRTLNLVLFCLAWLCLGAQTLFNAIAMATSSKSVLLLPALLWAVFWVALVEYFFAMMADTIQGAEDRDTTQQR